MYKGLRRLRQLWRKPPTRSLEDPRGLAWSGPAVGTRMWWGPLLTLALGGGGLYLLIQALFGLRGVETSFAWDFAVDYQTAKGFLQGIKPFTKAGAEALGLPQQFGPSGSGHPPTTSFWALPFVAFPLPQARDILAVVSLLMVFTELAATFVELGWPRAFGLAWVAFAYLVWCPFMPYHLAIGQFSAAIGFLYFVAWRAGRRGDQVTCGIAIGLAVTMKLFPGVMMLFLLITRRWRAVMAGVLAYLTIAALMTGRYGLDSWPFFFRTQPAIVRSWMGVISNQSVHGVVLRFFNPICVGRAVSSPASTAVSTVVALVLLAGGSWVALRRSHTRAAFDRSFGLFVVLSVITSQWTWEHYLVIYALPAAILVDDLVRESRQHPGRVGPLLMLLATAGIVATWCIDLSLKAQAQNAVLAGHKELHLRLHLLDLANWAPAFVLAGMLAVRSLQRAAAPPSIGRPK